MASEMMILPEVAELLEAEARRINAPEFVAADPVQFPRQFSALPDIEIAAFLSATIAWGNRKMICTDCTFGYSMAFRASSTFSTLTP